MQDRAHDTPLCPEGDFRFWAGMGAAALGAYVLGCLAGLPGVVAQGPDGAGVIARLSAAGAATVWVVLCTGALSAGFAAVSLVRELTGSWAAVLSGSSRPSSDCWLA